MNQLFARTITHFAAADYAVGNGNRGGGGGEIEFEKIFLL
jgi:hypothetical protein